MTTTVSFSFFTTKGSSLLHKTFTVDEQALLTTERGFVVAKVESKVIPKETKELTNRAFAATFAKENKLGCVQEGLGAVTTYALSGKLGSRIILLNDLGVFVILSIPFKNHRRISSIANVMADEYKAVSLLK